VLDDDEVRICISEFVLGIFAQLDLIVKNLNGFVKQSVQTKINLLSETIVRA